jgi:hypothetical protein
MIMEPEQGVKDLPTEVAAAVAVEETSPENAGADKPKRNKKVPREEKKVNRVYKAKAKDGEQVTASGPSEAAEAKAEAVVETHVEPVKVV